MVSTIVDLALCRGYRSPVFTSATLHNRAAIESGAIELD